MPVYAVTGASGRGYTLMRNDLDAARVLSKVLGHFS